MVDAGERADYIERISADGFAIVEDVISPAITRRLREEISAIPDGDEVRRRTNVFGVRNLLEVCGETRQLAASTELRACVTPVLGPGCFAVRATFFDKVPDANWKLRWHQDTVISVKDRVDVPGFTAWSTKAGVQQVRPPEDVLKNMLAIRVHLDDCSVQNAPLRVLAGSHSKRWSRDEVTQCKSRFREVVCEVAEGGILAMRPLAVHASSSSEVPAHRRVVHIEYACNDLPDGLQWHTKIPESTAQIPTA